MIETIKKINVKNYYCKNCDDMVEYDLNTDILYFGENYKSLILDVICKDCGKIIECMIFEKGRS